MPQPTVYVSQIMTDQIATGPSTSTRVNAIHRTVQANGVTTSGAGALTLDVEVSNDGLTWIVLGTITLVLSTVIAGDGFASVAPWKFMRGNITAISGTGAKANLFIGSVGNE